MDHIRQRLIAIHGLSGSGKSIVAKRMRDHHGFAHASSGAMCRTITEMLYGNQDRGALNNVSQAIRTIDKEIWIRATLRGVEGERIVFDSVRYLQDAIILRELGFDIWKISCPTRICIDRLVERGQVFDLSDFSHDSEREIPDDMCQNIIENYNCTIRDLELKIDSLVRENR